MQLGRLHSDTTTVGDDVLRQTRNDGDAFGWRSRDRRALPMVGRHPERCTCVQFEIHKATNGQYFWRIVASNRQVLATSETYYNKSDAQRAAQSVKTNAASAPIVDKTGTSAHSRW